ncbi:MAG TPA: hypothetical protein VFC51_14695 [Chloroflexota bacterium]|nr:hypothetical protein [Chloroflexota bacterium]
MPSYVDELSEDRERVLKALRGLIEEQEARVRALTEALAQYTETLDRRIIRTMIFRNTFGATQTNTLMAEGDTQDATRPVTETTVQLERENEILHAYRQALRQVETGARLVDALGKFAVGS